MKYIIFKDLSGTQIYPFLFPDYLAHGEVSYALKTHEGPLLIPFSAGFVEINSPDDIKCSDAKLVGMHMNELDEAYIKDSLKPKSEVKSC